MTLLFCGYDIAKGTTTNLLDYTAGTDLVKHQWDAIHDPGIVIGMFERDEEGMMKIYPCIHNKPTTAGTQEGQLQIVKGSKTIPNGYGGTSVICEERYFYHIEDKPYTACCNDDGKDVIVRPEYETGWYTEEQYCKEVIKPILISLGITNGNVTVLSTNLETRKISAAYNLEQFFKDRPISDDILKTLETSYYLEICKEATISLSGSGIVEPVNIEFDIVLAFTGIGEARALLNYLKAKNFLQGAKLFASRTNRGIEIYATEGGEKIALYTDNVLKELKYIDDGGDVIGSTGKIGILEKDGSKVESVLEIVKKDGQIGFRRTIVIDKASNIKNFITLIDDKIKILPKEALFGNQASTFPNSEYITAEALEELITYRRFGGAAKLRGSYVSTKANLTREELALVKDFNNSMRFEAIIKIPKGEKLALGKVGPWPPKSPEYMGGADQVIIHRFDFPENAWVESIKDLETGKIYTYGEFCLNFPNLCVK